MKMVPRFPERVLSALGASKYFRDDVLGDLAEEFAIRAEFDLRAARRWYYREAWRAAPYFVRNAVRSLRRREVLGVGSAILVALTGATIFRDLFFRVAEPIVSVLDLPPNFLLSWFMAPVFVLVNAITPTAGGYVAAWAHKKAPLLTAVTLGIVWSAIDVAVIASAPAEFPALYRYGAPFMALVFSTVGGLLRVWNRPRVVG
jgi:hypothetical protein